MLLFTYTFHLYKLIIQISKEYINNTVYVRNVVF
jgi:hypothetical protein